MEKEFNLIPQKHALPCSFGMDTEQGIIKPQLPAQAMQKCCPLVAFIALMSWNDNYIYIKLLLMSENRYLAYADVVFLIWGK